jgi:hypothetical protein
MRLSVLRDFGLGSASAALSIHSDDVAVLGHRDSSDDPLFFLKGAFSWPDHAAFKGAI